MLLGAGWIILIVLTSLISLVFVVWLALWITSRLTWNRVIRGAKTAPVLPVDLSTYQGKWYEIARYPQTFQTGCKNVTATYSLGDRDGGLVRVVNSCELESSSSSSTTTTTRIANGWARPSGIAPNVLGVSFFPKQKWLPSIYGSYHIVKLESPENPDTGLSIVSNPDKTSLWILARKPRLGSGKLANVQSWLRENDYPLDNLIVNQ